MPLPYTLLSRKHLLPLLALALSLSCQQSDTRETSVSYPPGVAEASGRAEYEWMRIHDPSTGAIPYGMRAKEIAFASTLPSSENPLMRSLPLTWEQRGPVNVGGRTRGLAIDITDTSHILAASVSGSVWNSNDGGLSWSRVTAPDVQYGATKIIQDTRPGMTDTWYFSTGEPYGNSAGHGWAASAYIGNGIYKSTDKGQTWDLLQSTTTNSPQTTQYWDLSWNIAIDPSDTADIIYAANPKRIFRSADGGTSWSSVLGTSIPGFSSFTDVAVSPNGVVFATLSSDGPDKGIYRSVDGISYTKITPPGYPANYRRIVIGISPHDENTVYFLANTPGAGKLSILWRGGEDWNSLWRYDHDTLGGTWTDLSQNLPGGDPSVTFNAQGSYNLLVRVHPAYPDVVFIGGTNLYRSDDAFTSDTNTLHLAGYSPGTTIPFYDLTPQQHPDHHELLFNPLDPDIMYSGNDGGVFRTNDCLSDTVEWTSLNKGYFSTQFYTVAIDRKVSGSNIIIGGLQDNGTLFTNSLNPQDDWTAPGLGDGSHCAIADSASMFYFSRQNGRVVKKSLDANGNVTGLRRIDPVGGTGYLFINPLALDPNNNNIMYLPAGNQVWRNHDLSQIALDGGYDSIPTNWIPIIDSAYLATGVIYSAVAVSENPANVLYYGSYNRQLYRISGADTGYHQPVRLDGNFIGVSSGAYINCIAIDPRDADKIMVVISSYSVYSVLYSDDGGQSFIKVAGNLEQTPTGGGNGPSCRWASIMPVGNKTIFWLGTSTGLYATDTLIDGSTTWIQQAKSSIGNSLVDMVVTRPSDGLVVVGTHGNGVWSTHITDPGQISGILTTDRQTAIAISAFPNPSQGEMNFEINLPVTGSNAELQIYSLNGQLVKSIPVPQNSGGKSILSWNGSAGDGREVSPGVYLASLITPTSRTSIRIIITR